MKYEGVKLSQEQQNKLKEIDVIAVYLFGSQIQGTAGPLSDLDIGIVFADPEKYRDNTLGAYNELYRLFSGVFAGAPGEIDIVFLQFTSLALQHRAIRDGKVLYDPDRQARFSYQEEILKRNADMQYFYRLSYRTLLERI